MCQCDIMNSFLTTGRLLSRAIWNGIANVSTASDPNFQRKPDAYLVSAVCGFSKERKIQRLIKGQFGDDAWFTAMHKTADVLGKFSFDGKHNLLLLTFGHVTFLVFFFNVFNSLLYITIDFVFNHLFNIKITDVYFLTYISLEHNVRFKTSKHCYKKFIT